MCVGGLSLCCLPRSLSNCPVTSPDPARDHPLNLSPFTPSSRFLLATASLGWAWGSPCLQCPTSNPASTHSQGNLSKAWHSPAYLLQPPHCARRKPQLLGLRREAPHGLASASLCGYVLCSGPLHMLFLPPGTLPSRCHFPTAGPNFYFSHRSQLRHHLFLEALPDLMPCSLDWVSPSAPGTYPLIILILTAPCDTLSRYVGHVLSVGPSLSHSMRPRTSVVRACLSISPTKPGKRLV